MLCQIYLPDRPALEHGSHSIRYFHFFKLFSSRSRGAGRSIPACETIVDKKIAISPQSRAARYRDFPHFSSDLHTIKNQIKNIKIKILHFYRVNQSSSIRKKRQHVVFFETIMGFSRVFWSFWCVDSPY